MKVRIGYPIENEAFVLNGRNEGDGCGEVLIARFSFSKTPFDNEAKGPFDFSFCRRFARVVVPVG